MTSPQPKFDKEIELKKIDLVSEEIRNRFNTALGAYFLIMIAIIAAAFQIGIQVGSGGPLPVITEIGLVIIFPVVAWFAYGTINRFKAIFSRFQLLITNIQNGKTNGDLDEMLRKLRD